MKSFLVKDFYLNFMKKVTILDNIKFQFQLQFLKINFTYSWT